MSSSELFSEFEKQDATTWIGQIEKDLKGKDISTLRSQLEDGITIQPVYPKENTQEQHQAFRKRVEWRIVQEIAVEDEIAANKLALEALNGGASSLLFRVSEDVNLEVLLKEVLIEHISIHFVISGSGTAFWSKIEDLLKARSLDRDLLNGSINIDCLENLARTGDWFVDQESDMSELAELAKTVPSGIRTIGINTSLFANAGATHSQQLGIALAMAYEYISELQLSDTFKLWFNFAIGSNYFGEISKLRAFRRLLLNLEKTLDITAPRAPLYCETSLRNKSSMDVYNNMIRTTAEAMAAVIGGCDELAVKSYEHSDTGSDFGNRIARNQQSILAHESYLDKVKDIAGGSFFIENITEELASAGWEFFKEIEKRGGFIEAMKLGWLQGEIERSATKEQEAFDSGNKVLIGVNKYRNESGNVSVSAGESSDRSDAVVRSIKPVRLASELEQNELSSIS